MSNIPFSNDDLNNMRDLGIYAVLNGIKVEKPIAVRDGDSLQFKALDGWEFVAGSYGDYTEMGFYVGFEVSEDNLQETNVITLMDLFPDVNFFGFDTVNVGGGSGGSDVIFSDEDVEYCHINHYSPYINGVELSAGVQVVDGDLIEFRALDGWEFTTTQFGAGFYDSFGVYQKLELDESGRVYSYKFDGASIPENMESFTGINVKQVDVETAGGVNNCYLMTEQEIEELTKARLYEIQQGTNEGEIATDFEQYLINLMMLPFDVPEDVVLDREKIQVGRYTVDVSSQVLSKDVIRFDLGSISIPVKEGNLLDYTNTLAILHLPFINPINIELSYVIGETLNVVFDVDVYTGLGTYNVISSRLESSIYMTTVDLGVNIPLANVAGDQKLVLAGSLKIGGDNLFKTPYLEIIRSNADINKGFFSVPILDEGELKDVEGFVTVEEIDLNNRLMMGAERDDIIRLLSSGVIV